MDEKQTISADEMLENKDKIKTLLLSAGRPGMDRLLDWIENKTDFYTAPASTKYHLACEGGLAHHSLNVYALLRGKVESGLLTLKEDTIIITSLLHDLCKVNFYVRETKNVKDGTKINAYGKEVANWIEKEVWSVRDAFPVGHGEKSCYYIQSHIRLTDEEYAMIRLHMGSDRNGYPDPFSESAAIYPGVVAIHTSDLESAYIVEIRG
ncbi:MAG: metal-dependent phosphohydrolase [Oscillospiraceae bacterium]|nr:metal-dependent phosphohydrolase [Oscillospiraceae bacterium]